MSQAEALYRLQEIELGLLRGQNRLKEVNAALENDTVLQAAQGQVAAAEKALRPLQTKMRNLDLEMQSNSQKAQSTEQRLYSGTVKNPKELQDMQQEIEALKNWNLELENRLLEAMVAVEGGEAALKSSEENLAQVQIAWEDGHKDLLAEQAQLEQQIAVLKGQLVKARDSVTPENLKTYNALKPRKANQPMALMQGQSCAVCGIEQNMAIVQEVRRGSTLVTCLGCGRILVQL